MKDLFNQEEQKLLNLPPRNDTETEILGQYDFSEGMIKFAGQEFIFPSGLHAEAIAKWLESDLLSVEIKISAEVNAPCARCLKIVSLEISDKLMYLYYLQGAEALDDFDDYMPVEVDYFGHVLDIMPQINESVYTLLPTKILCKEDCKGLCPNCGKDLNEGPCSCKIESIDPRLEALRNFNFS
ncbi:MAG: DUF177 domain-containing protein [Synergistales bacterium]|nr:DUF177 domain-containing protein [Synergistales bacterium]MDY6400940.1 DUF177 domain-containing protein [Synergistales bacterium]MDY6405354.1 DUF177 domain-containing protein [Synergistales bacterium]MDY6410718.1 DUF177 domain-containing protein [Synergistales bacterium]MDY6413747.1 DUF177 domain-containing protein [Synergistales bacterium]